MSPAAAAQALRATHATERRVSMNDLVREFAGGDALCQHTLHSAADAIAIASIPGSWVHQSMTAEQFAVLQEFVAHAAPAFEPALRREIIKSDQTEPSFFGGERLVSSGELVP